MLNNTSDKGTVQDELKRIQHCLMEKDYYRLDKAPLAIRLIEDMLSESHPSGYPDPDTLACVAGLLREDKFREQREKRGNTPLTEGIQVLMDRVKKLKTQAEVARPADIPSPGWRARHWDAGLVAQLFSFLVLAPFFLLSVILLFFDISLIWKVIILSGYLGMSTFLAVAIKNYELLCSTLFIAFIVALFITLLHVNHLSFTTLTLRS